jgi:glycosyltransferase involved in cell wall biosynthesis
MSETGEAQRVLQVTPRMAPHIGGVETHVREVARRLPEHGVQTEVLTTDHAGDLPPFERIDGVPVRRVRAWPSGSENLFAPAILSCAASEKRWDVIHVQCFHTFVAPLAMAGACRRGVPYVVTFHGGGHSSRLRNALRRPQLAALRPLLARASALVAIADFEIDRYSRMLGIPRERFVTIPNGSDLPRPSPGLGRAPGTLIVSCGRLERYKGHDLAIAALPHVLREISDARLWIAGRGPAEQELREQARRLGVAHRVEFGALSSRQAMADRLSGASLALLLSSFETQPLAALEALSLDVPLLVAANSGLAELASKGYARWVDREAPPQAHARAIVRQIRDPLEVRDFALPSWDECASALAALYRRVDASAEQGRAVTA